jgi:excisionase family DNA binding protein
MEWLTVDEAAERLRIGRTLAYSLTKEYLTSDGESGLPCRRFGRVIRVPAAALDELATTV